MTRPDATACVEWLRSLLRGTAKDGGALIMPRNVAVGVDDYITRLEAVVEAAWREVEAQQMHSPDRCGRFCSVGCAGRCTTVTLARALAALDAGGESRG